MTAGLTPAWQQILVVDRLRAGEVNRAREVHWCASGKVLNAALAAHHLGGDCRPLALVGGRPGREVEEDFAALGICARWVVSSAPTRICTTVVDASAGRSTELVENAREVEREALEGFLDAWAEEVPNAASVVLIGSLPPGAPSSFYRDLLERAPAKVVLDARGDALLHALEMRPFLVKPNREELSRTLATRISNDGELLAAMRELNRRGAEWVLVTDGPRPVWVTSATEAYRLATIDVPLVNPIGSGDSMAAGIAWAVEQGREPVEAARVGVAAAADNASRLLMGRIDAKRVASLVEEVSVTRVNR